jgi:hypothetical protein
LSDISVTQDETNSAGWEGTLTFTEATQQVASAAVNNNASTTTNTGSAGTGTTVSGSPLQQLLQRAGIS